MDDTLLLNPGNTGPAVERVWMFVSRDTEGRENVCGSLMGELGTQPLMTGNPRLFEQFQRVARRIAEISERDGTGLTIHLLEFTCRREVEDWRCQ